MISSSFAQPARAPGAPRTAGRLAPFWLLVAILRAPFTRHTWAGLLYIVVGLPFAALATVLAAPLVVGAPLTITLIGMPLVVITLLSARRLAGLQRDLAGALIGEQVDAPRPVRRSPGFRGWVDAGLRDAAGWRAVGYFALKLPLAVAGSYLMLALPVFGSSISSTRSAGPAAIPPPGPSVAIIPCRSRSSRCARRAGLS